MTERIDHAAEATRLEMAAYDSINSGSVDMARIEMDGAKLHATLALMEQQRIANLIALSESKTPLARQAMEMLADYSESTISFTGSDDDARVYRTYDCLKPDIKEMLSHG